VQKYSSPLSLRERKTSHSAPFGIKYVNYLTNYVRGLQSINSVQREVSKQFAFPTPTDTALKYGNMGNNCEETPSNWQMEHTKEFALERIMAACDYLWFHYKVK
jgi:hypothetical protein